MTKVGKAKVLAVLLVLATGCGTAEPEDGLIQVVATTTILGDLVANVVGDDGSVETLVPIGTDAHDFQPSSAQVAMIHEADLVVSNGLGLEAGLEDVLDAARADGVRVIEIAPGLDPIPLVNGSLDPHVWMDPLRMADAALVVAEELAAVVPEVDWATRGASYAALLAREDGAISDRLASVESVDRLLVTNHEVLGYFAVRYDWQVIGTIFPGGSSLAAPDSAHLAATVGLIEDAGVRVIFTETTQPDDVARAVAAEIDGPISLVALHTESLGGPGSGAETLIEMLQTNADLIISATLGSG